MADNSAKTAAVQGTLKERPFPRLLQQLYRKKFTGYFVIADETRDESEVYLREGCPVHVRRPVDTDRLDNLLVEYGVVPQEIVATASAQVTDGLRLGDVLERMGALDKQKLAQVLKSQVVRKLTRLFFVVDGTYAIYLAPHVYGEGEDLSLMRVDPRGVIYPGIRAAYDLPRVTQEVTRLLGQRFRLRDISPAFIAALGMAAEDATVDSLRQGWLTLDDLDAITSRPLEVRSIVLALYYSDLLEREPIHEPAQPVSDSAIPRPVHLSQSSDVGSSFRLPGDSGPENSHPPSAPAPVLAQPETAVPSPPAPTAATGFRPRPTPPPPTSARPSSGERPLATPASSPSVPVVRTPFVSTVRADSMSPPTASVKPPVRATAAPSPEAVRASIQEMSQKLGKVTHFELLGVGQNASSDEVGTAFVRAARQFHPDRLVSAGLQDLQPLAERILSRINEAAMVLGDATRRAEYVSSLAAGPHAVRTNLPTLLEAENMFLKGEVFLKKGEHAKAIECFTSAGLGNPSEPQYRAYLAWTRFDDPHARKEVVVRETLKTMEDVVHERPKFARGFYWVGLLWKFLNEPDKAARAFREAVALDTSFIEAGRELRLIEMRKSKQSAGRPGSKPEPPRGGGLMSKFFKR